MRCFIPLCFVLLLLGCKQEYCPNQNRKVQYKLDTVSYSRIPYKDYDTIVLKLLSTNDTLSFFADKWIKDEQLYSTDPCEGVVLRQSRSLIFTCRGNKYESFNGMTIAVRHYIDETSFQEMMHIGFRYGDYVIPISKIGYNCEVDSITIQGTTYSQVNFIPNDDASPFPFGCFYSSKYGILKMHFIDYDWPVPQGGEPWELIKK